MEQINSKAKAVQNFFDQAASGWDQKIPYDSARIRELVARCPLKESSTILDVGCGTGILLPTLLQYRPEKIWAVDISLEMIKKAKTKIKDPRVVFLCQDVMELIIPQVDVVILYNTYPHIPDKEKFAAHMEKILGSGGLLAIIHSHCREEINNRHKNMDPVLSTKLLPVPEEYQKLSPWFALLSSLDNQKDYFMVLQKL